MSDPSTGELDARNAPHLEALTGLLREGQVALLFGAGTSMACGYPGLDEFLEVLEGKLVDQGRGAELEGLSAAPYERVDRLAELLGEADFRLVFGQTFRRRGAPTPPWIHKVLELPARILLTTNYTAEIEEAARRDYALPMGPEPERGGIPWHDHERVARALRRLDARQQLIYLHGRYDDSPVLERGQGVDLPWSRVILGETSYKYAYEHPGAVQQRLAAICQLCTLLVVGSSLRDEDLTRTLRSVAALAGESAPPHYALLPLFAGMDPKQIERPLMKRFRLQPVFYAAREDDHTDLERLTAQLVEGLRSIEFAGRTSAPEARSATGSGLRIQTVHTLAAAEDFQPRPRIERSVIEFALDGQGGVLALIGIGGAGKTTIARRAQERLEREGAGHGIAMIFVWSFYENPDIHGFMLALLRFLVGEVADLSEQQALESVQSALREAGGVVLILDGLERVQRDLGGRGELHGSLESPTLRRFLDWIAQVSTPTRAILTSRFALPELTRIGPSERVRCLEVDFLTRPQARGLLLSRGGPRLRA